ncbi:MAG: hypothetical protein JOY58_19330, partial [Solirubrobacterales bacterium]|nr:hypothetical protein [Solirubrobacterales bacterium]
MPGHLRTEEGRRAAFKAAKERLAPKAGRSEQPEVAWIEPDPEKFEATRGWGRRTWYREAHKELLRRREQDAKPIARSRAERLLEALHRLEENQQVEIQASEAYERWQAQRRERGVPGQRLGIATEGIHAVAGAPRCEQDRSGLADDAHPGSADRAGDTTSGCGDL